MKWKPRFNVKNQGRKQILVTLTNKNGKVTEREIWHYTCAMCPSDKWYRDKEIQLDHIISVVPVTGWVSFDDFIDRLLCQESGFQKLCRSHHEEKSKLENTYRPKKAKKLKK